ncbi:leucine-rich repeat domain-containing protein [Candidatus Uabimicrobium sp. HlEnr_7]|uniref:leucine-rich repeat domain-containing protein n=1 Tax=Candidatus Uabimicrobium helgolandensis TaxID=3095367 RepID=UPI00355933A0
MQKIRGKSLRTIENNTEYKGCTFYVDEEKSYYLENSIFDNCSFRTDVEFCTVTHCKFINCGFSDKLRLDWSGEKITNLPEETGLLPYITELLLCRNLIIPPEIFLLPRIVHLDLSSNELTKIPKEIGQLSSLQSLYIDDNRLRSLPKEIWQLYSLEYLSLSTNKLTKIPKEIGQLSSLVYLDLSWNRLTHIPKELEDLPKKSVGFPHLYLDIEWNEIEEQEQKRIKFWRPDIKF